MMKIRTLRLGDTSELYGIVPDGVEIIAVVDDGVCVAEFAGHKPRKMAKRYIEEHAA